MEVSRFKRCNMMHRVQTDALQRWIDSGKRGTLAIATGAGKSRIPIEYLKTIWRPDMKVLLSTPKTDLRDRNWKEEFSKWNAEHIWPHIVSECYQTIYKWKNTHWDLVIMDEAHLGISKQYGLFLENNSFDQIIGLSATPPVSETLDRFAPVIFTYTLDEAIEDEIVNPFNLTIVNHKLGTEKTIKAGNKKNSFYQSEEKRYLYLSNQLKAAYNKPKRGKYDPVMIAALHRANFLYSLPSKIEPAKKILSSLKGRTLVFTERTDILDKITPYGVHSNKSDEANEKILSSYMKGEIDTLGSVGKLKEGVNLPGLSNLLVVSYSSSDRDMIQKLGRVLRKDSEEVGDVYIFVTKNTQEEIWYSKMTEGLNLTNIRYL